MQQHPNQRRSRIRRYLHNLTSFLRPMPPRYRNPPPGNVPETNLVPLPQPPPTPTMSITPKHGDHIPPMHASDTNPPSAVTQQPHRRLRMNHTQSHQVRAHSDLSPLGMNNPRSVYHPLPTPPLDPRNHVRQQMLLNALQRRAGGMHASSSHHATPHLPVGQLWQPLTGPADPMLVDTIPGVTADVVPTIGVTPPSHTFINHLSSREYNPQLSIPTSNMPFTLPQTAPRHPQSSTFPDPTLLPSSIPPHQLARLYGMLQRTTTSTPHPPHSATPKPAPSGKSRRVQKQRAHKSPRSRATRMLKGDHMLRMLTLSQAPSHWFGALEITQMKNGASANVTIPVGAFLYTLTNKPAFTASLPESIKLGTDTARKFDDVVNTAAGGEFMIRVSPVNDYGHAVGNTVYADFVNACLVGSCVHCVQMNAGSLFLFPVSFPQVGLAFVAIFVSN